MTNLCASVLLCGEKQCMDALQIVVIASAAFAGGLVNGALGYGFSSVTVPIALLFFTNRTLNPALVCVELLLNGSILWINRDAIGQVIRRVIPIVTGLMPGVAIGTLIVGLVDASVLRLVTLVTLLPLILLQAAGWRRTLSRERVAGLLFGTGVGVLYA